MPLRPFVRCSHPACGLRYRPPAECPKHGRTKFYKSALWREMRLEKLTRDPYCARCGALADSVDHIDGNWRNNNPLNYASMCTSCHAKKTRADHGSVKIAPPRVPPPFSPNQWIV